MDGRVNSWVVDIFLAPVGETKVVVEVALKNVELAMRPTCFADEGAANHHKVVTPTGKV